MEIIFIVFPWILMLVFFIKFFKNINEKRNKLDNNQKEILNNANKKINKVKIGLIILMLVLTFLIFYFVDLLKVNNECAIAVVTVDEAVGFKLESVNRTSDLILEFIKLPLDIMVSTVITYYIFLIYIEKSKKIEDNERKILTEIYSGMTITGIIIVIINAIYKVIFNMIMTPAAKPIIYLYPEKEEKVEVKINKKEILTHTYPKYNEGWNVTAHPDGTLEDGNGRKYYALYWEGLYKVDIDKTKGFCVKGEDTIKFLEEKLEKLGLNEREAEEFIVYWLPQLENNEYNYIYFKQTEEVNDITGLDISPKPDTLIRILMVFKPLNKKIKVEEQEIVTPSREGFTVVEWGGSKI